MARINNTTTFPNTTPALNDHVIGTDVSNTSNSADGETVTFLLSDIVALGTSAGTVFLEAIEPAGTETEIDIALPAAYGAVSIDLAGLNHGNSTDRNLQVRFSTDGGSTFLASGNYEWRRAGTTSTAQNEISVSANHDRAVGHGVHGEIKIFGHGRTDTRTGLISRVFTYDGIDIDGPDDTVGKLLATTAVTHVRLTFEGQTLRNEGVVIVRGHRVT